MFCKKCGNQLKDGAKFCPKCGCQVLEEVNDQTSSLTRQKQKAGKNWLIILVILVIVGVVVVGISFVLKGNAKKVLRGDDSKNGTNLAGENSDRQETEQEQDELEAENELEWKVKKSTTTIYEGDGESIRSISTSEYEYDENGNMIFSQSTDDGSGYENVYTLTYKYDSDGRVINIKNDGSEFSVEWEKEGEKNYVGTVYIDGEVQEQGKIKEEYDDNGGVRTFICDEDGDVVYEPNKYDEEGRLIYKENEPLNVTEECIYEQNRYVYKYTHDDKDSDIYRCIWIITELDEDGMPISTDMYRAESEAEEPDLSKPVSDTVYEYEDNGTIKKVTQYSEDGTVYRTVVEERIRLPRARPQFFDSFHEM